MAGKGKQLFEAFLRKAAMCSVAKGDDWWPAMLAVNESRKALEAYLDPPRDSKGHFVIPSQSTPGGK